MVENDYRSVLKNELMRRNQQNSQYTLRAFARDLGVYPSRLSEVIRGKQGLSVKSAEAICNRIDLSPHDRTFFLNSVMASDSRSKIKREKAKAALSMMAITNDSRKLIQNEIFEIISQWYHYAIMELTTLEDFKPEIKWISKKLGIKPLETTEAIKRLEQLKLIKWSKNTWVCTESDLVSNNDIPSMAIRKFHESLINKAKQALFEQPIDEREISSTLISIRMQDIPKIKEYLRSTRKNINDMAGNRKSGRNEVYCLSMQFFKLTRQGDIYETNQ
jgi:uncharacterized protein (TIGR02147 family)